jgi:hypothetical protein
MKYAVEWTSRNDHPIIRSFYEFHEGKDKIIPVLFQLNIIQ